MAFFTLNGRAIPVEVASGEREIEVIGDTARAADTGRLLESRTAIKTRLPPLRTPPLPLAEADALQLEIALATVGAPLLCGGDLVGAVTREYVAEGKIGLKPVTLAGGERRGVVTFALQEV